MLRYYEDLGLKKKVGFTDPQARSLTMTMASGHSSKILS